MNIKKKLTSFFFILFLSLLFFYSCNKEDKETELALIYSYLDKEELAFDTLPNGMFYSLIDTLYGELAKENDTIKTVYKAYYINNDKSLEIFDEKTFLQPHEYVNKKDPVIFAWEYAMTLMENGDSATFIVPSKLAYKNKQTGIIPPNSPLLFRVRVVDVISPTKD